MPSSSRGSSSSDNYKRKRQKSQRRSKAFDGGGSSTSTSSSGGKHSGRRGTSSRHRREQRDGEAGRVDEGNAAQGQSASSPSGYRPAKSTMAKHHELVQSIVDVETGDDFLDGGLNEDFDDDVQTDDDIETICEMLRRPGLPCVCTGLILLTLLSWLRNWAFGSDPSLKRLETGSVTPRFPKGFESQAQEAFLVGGGARGSPSPPPTHGLHVAEGAFESNWHNSAGGNYAPFAPAGQPQQSFEGGGGGGGGGGGPMWAADGYPAAGAAPAVGSAAPFFEAPQLAAPDNNALFQAMPGQPDVATANAWSLPQQQAPPANAWSLPQQQAPPATDIGADPGPMPWSNMQTSTEAGFPASFAGEAETGGTWTSSVGAAQRRGRRAVLWEANKRPSAEVAR